jgi:alpha-tubulin suppressor-like RCC1 family protein
MRVILMRMPAFTMLSVLLLVFVFLSGCAGGGGGDTAGKNADAVTLSAGTTHTCRRLDNGTLKCWGQNWVGQLGLGDTDNRGDAPGEMGDALPAVDLGSGRNAVALSAGSHHTCALLDYGAVKCWGDNGFGQLGLGDTDPRGDTPAGMGDALPAVYLGDGRRAVALMVGGDHTCALMDNGAVKCWGRNNYGQLGLGDTDNRGDAPGEMGDVLPAVDLGSGRSAVELMAGSFHTCALLDNGAVKCWGRNDYGQLGLGDTDPRGDAPGEMGDVLPAVDLGSGRSAVALAAGSYHTCALLDNGAVKCWGANSGGQLGLGDIDNRGDVPGEMGDALPTVDLGNGRSAMALAAGGTHTCALLDNGAVKCWGANSSGQLGLGDTDYRGDAPGEMGDALQAVDLGNGRSAMALAAGASHTCALLDNGAIKCWGHNGGGRLGLGDTNPRGDAPGEMGDALPAVDLGTP